MRDFQSDSDSKPPPIATLLVCRNCQSKMRVEMLTPVAIADHVSTVTLVCEKCGMSFIGTCQTD